MVIKKSQYVTKIIRFAKNAKLAFKQMVAIGLAGAVRYRVSRTVPEREGGVRVGSLRNLRRLRRVTTKLPKLSKLPTDKRSPMRSILKRM